MPVDLTTAAMTVRQGLLLDDDALVILESRGTSSRLWRIPYEQTQRLVVARVWPVGRIALISVVLGLPGTLLMLVDETAVRVIAAALLIVLAAVLTWYAVCRRTNFEVHFGHRVRSFAVIARPARIDRFIARFVTHVRDAQQAGHAEAPPPDQSVL